MSIRVLLADDHAVVRDGLRALLAQAPDLEVVGDVADGRQAVEAAARLKPDVAVLDIRMPQLNGIEAARQIRNRCPQVEVVILSMYADREYITRALEAGARGYVLKESAGQEVAHAIRAVHARRRYLSAAVADIIVAGYLDPLPDLAAPDPLAALSEREREVLQLIVEGRSSAEVGALLHLSPKTVDTYRSRLMRKLEISDLPGLVKFAIRHGLTSLE